jgi:hypothetical protein
MEISREVKEILKLNLRNLKDCNVGITDGRDLWYTPLKWTEMAWYTYQVPGYYRKNFKPVMWVLMIEEI